jgi:hypothetical protein
VEQRIMTAKIISEVTSKNIHLWLPGYIKSLLTPKDKFGYSIKDIIFVITDHFEPFGEKNRNVIDFWEKEYPKFAESFCDSDGYPPQHTWFFPIELYEPEILEKLSKLCKKGYGEIEVHLHHRGDSEESLRVQIRKGIENLANHGALKPEGKGYKPRFGFVHGDWALNNSRRDGRYCGVNDELKILGEEGCYADFTLPSAPSETQTKKINAIYYAKSDPKNPKAHNSGIDVQVGGHEWGDLMLIQGPLGLNWNVRKKGIFPGIENGEISSNNPGTKQRIKLWENSNIHVKGRPEWIFIKLHSHGGFRNQVDALIGEQGKLMHQHLKTIFRDNTNYRLHYVTARESYNIIKAAEAGETGNPNNYRNYIIPSPANKLGVS